MPERIKERTRVLSPLPAPEESDGDAARETARALAADPLNQAIIKLLQQDGRLPFSTLARHVDTSEATVRNRVNRMIATRMLRVIAVVDPTVLGHTAHALIGLRVSGGTDLRVAAQRFRDLSEVIYVLFTAGRYDLIVEVVCEDHDKLRAFLIEHCYGRPDVSRVEPMVGLHLFKSEPPPIARSRGGARRGSGA